MNHGHVKPRTWEIMYDKVRGGDEFIHGESTKDKWVNVVELSAYQAALDEIEKLREALNYYAHPDHYTESQTLSGIRQPGVLSEGGRLARNILKKSEARFPKGEKV